MSLDYNLTAIKNYREVCWLPDPTEGAKDGAVILNPVTQALIFGAMAIGIGEITPATAEEFWQRVAMEEKINGSWLKQEQDGTMVDRLLTPADIYAHMGLRTNVFPKRAASKWRTQLLQRSTEDASRAWKAFLADQRASEEVAAKLAEK